MFIMAKKSGSAGSQRQLLQFFLIAAVVVAVALGKAYRDRNQSPDIPAPDSPPGANRNIRFGLPAPAGTSPDAYLIERPQYVLSYNDPHGLANWVCWQLIAADVGKA